MRKCYKIFLLVYKQRLATILEYRTNFLLRIVAGLVSFIFLVAVWQGLRPQDFKTILWTFYVLVAIIGAFNGEGFYRQMSSDINTGQLSFYLSQPFPYLLRIIARLIADVSVSTGIGIIVIFVVGLFLQNLLNLSIVNILLAIPIMFLGRMISILLNFLAGCLSFVWNNPDALYLLLDVFLFFLYGSLVPFWLLPEFFQKLFLIFPFRAVIATPVEIMMGVYQDVVLNLSSGLLWLIVLAIFSKMVWDKVLVHYEAVGN